MKNKFKIIRYGRSFCWPFNWCRALKKAHSFQLRLRIEEDAEFREKEMAHRAALPQKRLERQRDRLRRKEIARENKVMRARIGHYFAQRRSA